MAKFTRVFHGDIQASVRGDACILSRSFWDNIWFDTTRAWDLWRKFRNFHITGWVLLLMEPSYEITGSYSWQENNEPIHRNISKPQFQTFLQICSLWPRLKLRICYLDKLYTKLQAHGSKLSTFSLVHSDKSLNMMLNLKTVVSHNLIRIYNSKKYFKKLWLTWHLYNELFQD